MKIVNSNALEWVAFSAHRSGSDTVTTNYFRFKRLLRGREGSPRNFELTLAQAIGNPPVPRHRHNFDQLRFQLTGTYAYKPDAPMSPGDLTYFPEGAYYGPETATDDPIMLVLQFGGASDFGFMSMDQLRDGYERVRKRGTFDKGVYRGPDSHGKVVELDGYEAVWDEVVGSAVIYAEPRYTEPVMMRTSRFQWRDGAHGIQTKTLGLFTERRTEVAMLRLAPGAGSLATDNRDLLLFVWDGGFDIAGEHAGVHGAVEVPAGERADYTSSTGAQALMIYLPLADAG